MESAISLSIGMKLVAGLAARRQRETQVFRANGLQAWGVLGLLSGRVGLLRSCIEYQEVILFSGEDAIRGCVDVSH